MKDYLEDNYNKLLFYDIAVHENTGWFCNRLYSVLFRINLESGEISVESILPTESECDIEQYGPIEYYDNQLIIAPRNGKSILIYDLESKEINKVNFDLTEFGGVSRYNLFTGIHIVNNIAYIVPGRYHAVIKLHLDTYQVEYLDSWYQKILESSIDEGKVISVFSVLESSKVLKMADWQNSQIIEINLEDGSAQTSKVKNYGGISSFNVQANFNLVAYKEKAKIVNVDTQEELDLNINGINYDGGIKAMFVWNNMVYIFPVRGNMVLSVDYEKKIQKEFISLPKEPVKGMEEAAFVNINFLCVKKIEKNKVIASSLYENKIYLIDLENGTYIFFPNSFPIETEEKIRKKITKYYFANLEIEKGNEEVDDWLKAIVNNRLNNKEEIFIQDIGTDLYKKLVKEEI